MYIIIYCAADPWTSGATNLAGVRAGEAELCKFNYVHSLAGLLSKVRYTIPVSFKNLADFKKLLNAGLFYNLV